MANYDFNKDIIDGEDGEQIVLRDLILMGAKFISDNKDNKYDLIVTRKNKRITYEIKTDVYCTPERDTGNMFIEFECRGKESGIMVTKADWFVTLYQGLNEIWYIKTNELLDLIKSQTFKETSNSGDIGSKTKGYLIPRNKYCEHFIIRTTNG
jgi:hypothetical protein